MSQFFLLHPEISEMSTWRYRSERRRGSIESSLSRSTGLVPESSPPSIFPSPPDHSPSSPARLVSSVLLSGHRLIQLPYLLITLALPLSSSRSPSAHDGERSVQKDVSYEEQGTKPAPPGRSRRINSRRTRPCRSTRFARGAGEGEREGQAEGGCPRPESVLSEQRRLGTAHVVVL
jgi:hypothetical protein